MGSKSPTGVLIGLVAAAGAFGAAAMMSAATAPTARADDFTDIINAVEGNFTDGQAAFTTAATDFGSNELVPGLAAFFDGVNDDSLSVSDNLLGGTVEAFSNEPITSIGGWLLSPPADFSAGVSDADAWFTGGETDLTDASSALTSGDYGQAAFDDLLGSEFVSIAPLEELLLGSVASF
jgi:hypothetical protein